ncbi:hypothetical protein TEA_025759 [Camellia sinensis var. sinensis]|uniref:BHLH domain-containing protein n=1 Tax=Camellia sinensis var. sinensis TaxID=542762 RepID=A0A4S4E5A5_CAMSN|nr:hypothetical protein TEA_025759 [Camellia sinensis var. sinensis]
MDSEAPAAPVVDKVSQLAETSANGRSHPSKKNQGKVPVRIHKSEREKMKREHLNELFIALANALGPLQQNNGKASILGETTRLLKEMHAQIEGLRRENAALLSESQYVSIEKNELHDENSALESQIVKLRIELQERVVHSKPDLNVPPPEESSHFSLEQPALQQAPPYGSPFYVIPVCSDPQAYSEQDTTQPALKPTTNELFAEETRFKVAQISSPPQFVFATPSPTHSISVFWKPNLKWRFCRSFRRRFQWRFHGGDFVGDFSGVDEKDCYDRVDFVGDFVGDFSGVTVC